MTKQTTIVVTGALRVNKMILAILNLHVTVMPPTKFLLNPTYHTEADVVWRFSWWPPWQPSWISEQNNFNNSKSLCCFHASYQVSAQSNSQFGRRYRLKGFKMATAAAILEILAILNLYVSPMLPIRSQLTPTYHSEADVAWRFSRWLPWWPSWISKWNDFSNS